MKRTKPSMPHMRTDFDFSTRTVICKNARIFGFSTNECKPGSWITFRNGLDDDDAAIHVGRVIGVADAKGAEGLERGVFLMLVTLPFDLTFPMMRWIRPELVDQCYPHPPKRCMEFMCGDWNDPQAICDTLHHGLLEDWQRQQTVATGDPE